MPLLSQPVLPILHPQIGDRRTFPELAVGIDFQGVAEELQSAPGFHIEVTDAPARFQTVARQLGIIDMDTSSDNDAAAWQHFQLAPCATRRQSSAGQIVRSNSQLPIGWVLFIINPFEATAGLHRATRVPAAAMLHYFRPDRSGQSRGVPDITPALPLFAMLRDYSLATLDAAKAAAYFAGFLYTHAPASGEAEAVEPLDAIELDRNLLLTMPGGWKMSQLEAQQPSRTNLSRFQLGLAV